MLVGLASHPAVGGEQGLFDWNAFAELCACRRGRKVTLMLVLIL